MRPISRAAFLAILAAGSVAAAPASARPVAVFTISEEFGVSHPLQIIDFDFSGPADPARSYMIGPEGNPVPFQRLANGKIAVETALPARARRSWQLFAGAPPRPLPAPVRVSAGPDLIEVVNGITGVRIARLDAARSALAPIQGIRLANGAWSARGPNYLSAPANRLDPPRLEARAAATRIIEGGPLRARVEVDYQYDRPALVYANRVLIPAGEGYYRSIITLDANSPSVMIEDQSDIDLEYRLDFFNEVEPDQGRYRGHHATAASFGREPDGRVYGSSSNPIDAERDFHYRVPTWSAFTTANAEGYSLLARLGLWNPWVYDSGWYWMMYRRSAPSDAPLVGIFPGPASRLEGAGNSGPGLMFAPAASGGRVAAISFQVNRRGPDAKVFPKIRVPWGIFVGTKGKDLANPSDTQNIARQTNLHAGINLNKAYRYQLAYPDPPDGVQPLYMRRDALLRIVNRARTVPSFFQYLYNAEPGGRPLYDTWRDATGEKVNAQAARILELARAWLDSEVNGEGIHDPRFAYWHGGLEANSAAPVINELLAIEPTSPRLRDRLKAAAALFGYLLWDNDLAPLDGNPGVNLGTANMPVQQYQYRHLYAVMLARNPDMKEHALAAHGEVAASLETEINAAGAQRASPHYADASMEPLLDAAQQIAMAGLGNLFESEPVISKFARFYMDMLTPPEVRFGGARKLISIGDGSTESSPIYGELGTYLAPVNPRLSRELMAAWRASGSAHSAFHGSTVLKIDEELPASRLKLGSAQWPGWCSVLRSGFDTPNESALWFINGDFYSDHRHEDRGSVTFYELGAPGAIDWGSMYSPHVSSPYMHSAVLPESSLAAPWAADNPNVENGKPAWVRSTQRGFAAFDDASWSAASFDAPNGSKWLRAVTLVHHDDSRPIILITDAIAGPGGGEPRIATLNLMARGAVATPGGPVTPSARLYDAGHNRNELPSAGAPRALAPGLNRFHFEGRYGVNWDLYTVASAPQQFLIGAWGHTWSPSAEAAQFQRANGQPFREEQYILRVRGTGALKTLIVPARTGGAPATVTEAGGRIRYRTGASGEGELGDAFEAWRTASQTTLTAFDEGTASAYGLSISGGPAEATLKYNHAFLTVTGPAGRREFHLGGDWAAAAPAAQLRPGVVVVDFDSSQTLHLTLSPRAAN